MSHFHKCYVSGVSFKEVFEDGIQRYSKEILELLVVVARGIWFRRNNLVFEGAFSHPDDVFSAAINFIREYKESLVKDKPLVQSEMNPGVRRDTATCIQQSSTHNIITMTTLSLIVRYLATKTLFKKA